jgi:uncharacterized protein YdeI (YjbR/CyaY-like superfamily)
MTAAKKPTKKSPKKKAKPEVMKIFKTQAHWHAWLEKHHEEPEGLWLHFAKKGGTAESCTYLEALDTALCFGWIDGMLKGHDENTFVRKFTPRRPRSVWSKINREKAEKLIKAGRMKPAGLRAIERAKEGGEWDRAYDSAKTASPPPDFQAELDKNPSAAAFFAKVDASNRYAYIWRIVTARNAPIRAKRISLTIDMLKKKKTFHPWTFK